MIILLQKEVLNVFMQLNKNVNIFAIFLFYLCHHKVSFMTFCIKDKNCWELALNKCEIVGACSNNGMSMHLVVVILEIEAETKLPAKVTAIHKG